MMAPSLRTRLAAALGGATGGLSRRVGRGAGQVVGAKVTLALAPRALDELAAGLRVAVVSGTNGKTTTTAMLAAACTANGWIVATNTQGANLQSGVVALLSTRRAREADVAVLEIDELALPRLLPSFDHPVVVLLNLSRDQLDRFGEVRTIADEWRRALASRPATVVANADDPLVVFAARAASDVTFVGVGQRWQHDAASCPACGRQIQRQGGDWWCECGLRRPAALVLDHDVLELDGAGVALRPGVPGQHNVGNAALAVVAATKLEVPVGVATLALETVTSVAGRYQTITRGSTRARLLLAKNPAGWAELLAMIEHDDRPLVVAINARIADGRDPSWIWDVPFEQLRGRKVLAAAGERATDLAVRLRYAEVICAVWDESIFTELERVDEPEVDLLVNYTVFADLARAAGIIQ